MKARIYKKYFYTLSHHIIGNCLLGNISQAKKDSWKLARRYIPFTNMMNFGHAINLYDTVIDYGNHQASIDDVRDSLINIWSNINAWHNKNIYSKIPKHE